MSCVGSIIRFLWFFMISYICVTLFGKCTFLIKIRKCVKLICMVYFRQIWHSLRFLFENNRIHELTRIFNFQPSYFCFLYKSLDFCIKNCLLNTQFSGKIKEYSLVFGNLRNDVIEFGFLIEFFYYYFIPVAIKVSYTDFTIQRTFFLENSKEATFVASRT